MSRIHHPVTVLGPGRRLGIWLQGCSIGCRGCVSRDTWDAGAGTSLTVDELLRRCRELVPGLVDGFTISGGEPFDQPDALGELIDGLRDWGSTWERQPDILCYSGRTERVLRRRHAAVLERIDAVIAGPYVAGAGPAHSWMGSANQHLVPLSPLGRERMSCAPAERRVQVSVDDDRIWMIGIPGPGDMERVERDLAARGLTLSDVSWR